MIQLAKKPEPQETPAAENTAAAPQQSAATAAPPPAPAAPPAQAAASPPPAPAAPPTPPPDGSGDDASGKKFDHMGNKPEDEASGEIESLPGNPAVEALKRAARRFAAYASANRKKLAVWTAAGVGGCAALYFAVFWAYTTVLFKSANEALAANNYTRAIEDFEAYQQVAGADDEKSSALLAKALLLAGEYEKITGKFGEYQGEDFDIRYAHALALFPSDPEESGVQMKALSDAAGEELASMPHIARARGVIAMLQENYTAASRLLKETYPDPEDGRYLRNLFSFFMNSHELSFSARVPLPFDALAEPIPNFSHIINYRIYPDGYDNSFNIPLSANNLAYDLSEAPLADIYRALSLLSDTLQNPGRAAETSREFRAANPGNKSLLAHYIMGYHLAAKDAAAAAEIYAAAAEFAKTSRAHQYHAAALWMREEGKPPSEEVVKVYQDAIAANEKNVPALNNYAFLELYLGNFDKAKEANAKAAEVSGTAPAVVINQILIGLADNSLDSEKALVSTDSLLGTNDKSALLVELAAQIRIRRQNIFGAAHFLQRLKDLRPNDPEVYRRIADVRRHSGQMLLAAKEIGEGLEKFPGNGDLLHDYAVYSAYAGNGQDVKDAVKKIKDEKIRKFTADRANMLLNYSSNVLDAIKAGEAALKATPPPERTAVAVELARLHLSAEDPGRAETLYKAAVNNTKQALYVGKENALRALNLRIKAADGDFSVEEQITVLMEETSKSENIAAQLDLCWALLSLDKTNTAISFLERIRTLQVQPPETLMVALQTAYQKSGQTANASEIKARIEAARKNVQKVTAGEIDVNLPEVKQIFAGGANNFAKSLNRALAEKNYELVVALYTELIDSKKDVAQKPAKNFQNRGVIYILLERYEEAISDFAKALTMKEQLTPEEADSVHYNYVNVLVKAREYQRAADEIQNRLDQPGDFRHEVQYLQLLGFSLSQIGRYKEASDTYKTLIDIHPDNVNNYIKLAGVARVEENFPLAIRTLTEGLEVEPSNIEMREMLYRIYNSLGQVGDAKRQLEFIKRIKKN